MSRQIVTCDQTSSSEGYFLFVIKCSKRKVDVTSYSVLEFLLFFFLFLDILSVAIEERLAGSSISTSVNLTSPLQRDIDGLAASGFELVRNDETSVLIVVVGDKFFCS